MINKIFLPSLTIEELNRLVDQSITKNDPLINKALKNTYDLILDDSFVYTNIVPIKKSVIPEALKTLSIKSSGIPEDGKKIKANNNTLTSILTQSTFGKTGLLLKLPHSGFAVKLRVITASMRSDLQYNLAHSIITIERNFTGDLYTAVYVLINETISRFFLELIDYATVDYKKKEDLLKYVKVKDLNLIQLAIMSLIYPEGYDEFAYICGNEITEESEVEQSKDIKKVCSASAEAGTIDLNELLYLTGDFTENELNQLHKTEKNCLSIKSVEDYQESFKYNEPMIVDLDDLTFTLEGGSLKNYIDKSKEWIRTSILENDSFDKDEIDVIATLIEQSAIGKYFYTINKIENESYISSDINVEHINIMSTNPVLADLVVNSAKTMLGLSAYIIGVPKYTCPDCLSRVVPKVDEEGNEIVTEPEVMTNINVLDLFIYLV